MLSICLGVICYFNPLPPHGGRLQLLCNVHCFNIFQSTPSAWRETGGNWNNSNIWDIFQSTPSAWRETTAGCDIHNHFARFQSTPSAWRETRSKIEYVRQRRISIHSLRMEGDCWSCHAFLPLPHFNPLPPHGGRRRKRTRHRPALRDFNPLPPHGGRRTMSSATYLPAYFNPLPPHGGRQKWQSLTVPELLFQSTPSAWRETTASL